MSAESDSKVIVFGEPHEGELKRYSVSAVIQRKTDGKFLLLKWKEYDWLSPCVGGIDGDESPEEAAEREVLEETGYHAKAIKKLGGLIESHFFAEHKNLWRHRIDQPVLLELTSEERESVSDDELKRHEVIWITLDEALKKITHKYNCICICRYLGLEWKP
ncbi:RNA pyrophosphohydrolase [uncultured archaeon]|nr:RNA pyrophosphohydrolase [uncultured archaeon]